MTDWLTPALQQAAPCFELSPNTALQSGTMLLASHSSCVRHKCVVLLANIARFKCHVARVVVVHMHVTCGCSALVP